ncbi:prolyl hydroxylase family protein [Sphingomonas sanxanigenens]|uniref:Fe2OG dioxygenase domain-containing protein n=1 Tax=Sphingomonas sanxanigenens DSM 19645 = NX02 TaxID=1123269 RepID=W0AHY8_9SPHN|nr:2OG-Fe(II) oxygenase [Sphingomonas sanxanigenens]AHE56731.1 hypothetical protein NX02_25630 [Sphingomonas sanxanigenens DSM 19645 = NX02]
MSHDLTPGSPSPRLADIGRIVANRLDAAAGVFKADSPHLELYYAEQWLSDDECAQLIAMIEADRVPSELMGDPGDPDFRNSESCNLDRWNPVVKAIDTRISDMFGLPHENGETVQGQRYAPGQQFKVHSDYLHPDLPGYSDAQWAGGQRSWTAMIYLNVPEGGGETDFPYAGLRVQPRAGMLLAWNNMNPDGGYNPMTHHQGMTVTAGVKYIITKWFREERWLPEYKR